MVKRTLNFLRKIESMRGEEEKEKSVVIRTRFPNFDSRDENSPRSWNNRV